MYNMYSIIHTQNKCVNCVSWWLYTDRQKPNDMLPFMKAKAYLHAII